MPRFSELICPGCSRTLYAAAFRRVDEGDQVHCFGCGAVAEVKKNGELVVVDRTEVPRRKTG